MVDPFTVVFNFEVSNLNLLIMVYTYETINKPYTINYFVV